MLRKLLLIQDFSRSNKTLQCQVWELNDTGPPRAVVVCESEVGVFSVEIMGRKISMPFFELKESCCHLEKVKAMLSQDFADVHSEHQLKCRSVTWIPFNRNTAFPSLVTFSITVQECMICGTST